METNEIMANEANETNETNTKQRITLGDWNKLRVVKAVDFGLYLDGGGAGEIGRAHV